MKINSMRNNEVGMRAEIERLSAQSEKRKRKKDEIIIDDDAPFFSKKKNIVRLVLFIIAFGLAIFFITFAVSQLVHKDPGWYEIECDADKEVPYYSSGVKFMYEFTGSSSDIGKLQKEITAFYTDKLKGSYKLFDPSVTYDDTVNIASVNSSRGEWVKIGDELFSVLKDALAKSEKSDAYSLFDGVFKAIRDPIVYSDTPLEADPVFDAAASELINELSSIMSGEFAKLEFNENEKSVRLTVSDELIDFCEAYELSPDVLDLGLLREAYTVYSVTKALEDRNYNAGYITTESGITSLLSGMKDTEIVMYSLTDEGKATISASFTASGGTASSAIRSFALYDEEYGFYSFEHDGETYYRNMFISDFENAEKGFSVLSMSVKGNAVTATFESLCALKYGVKGSIDPEGGENIIPAVELKSERGTIYTARTDLITLNETEGFKAGFLNYK